MLVQHGRVCIKDRITIYLPVCNFNLMTILWIKDFTLVLMVLDGSKMCTQNEIIGFSLFLMLLASY